jgi:hypothetical protein
VREIAESEAGTLPPYNQDLMRTIADQCADHVEAVQTLAKEFNEVNDAEDDGAEDADAREDKKGSLRTGMYAHHQVSARDAGIEAANRRRARRERNESNERTNERTTNERLTAFASRIGDIAE